MKKSIIFLFLLATFVFSNNKKEIEGKHIKKVVYLTFDDGPSDNTIKILDILKENNVKATFFVIGKNQEIMKRIVKEGHAIGLHTYTHKYKEIYASVDSYFKDLYKIRDYVYNKTGVKTKVIRFPGGSSTNRVTDEIKRRIIERLTKEGYIYQDWNCDSKDSSKKLVETNRIIKSSFCKFNKVNLLMHDSPSKTTTVKALDSIIKKYKENGYSFGILDENSPKFQHIKQSR